MTDKHGEFGSMLPQINALKKVISRRDENQYNNQYFSEFGEPECLEVEEVKQAEEYKKVIEVVFDNSIRAFESSKILSVERYAAKEKAELARQRHQCAMGHQPHRHHHGLSATRTTCPSSP